MHKFILTTIIAFLAANLGLYAQEKDTAQVEPKVKLELVYKKELDEMRVGPEGFPPSEIKQILKDKDIPQEDKDWVLNSLRIEIARREKILYTSDGKTIKLPDDLQSIGTSKNLKYMIVYAAHTDYGGLTTDEVKKLRDEWLDVYKKSAEWQQKWDKVDNPVVKQQIDDTMRYWVRISDSLNEKLREVTMKKKKEYKKFILMETETGKIIWEREDMPGWHYIADDGKLVIATGAGTFCGSAWYINEKGEVFKKVEFPGGFGRSGAMTSDGRRFCYLGGRTEKGSIVVCFDGHGNLLWQKEIEGSAPTSGRITISEDGKILVSTNATYLVDSLGSIIQKFNYQTCARAFDRTGQYAALLHRHLVEFIATENGNVRWRINFEDDEFFCDRITLTNNGEYIAITGYKNPATKWIAEEGRYKHPKGKEEKNQLLILDNTGQVVVIEDTDMQPIDVTLPIWFSQEGNFVLTKTAHYYLIYKLIGH